MSALTNTIRDTFLEDDLVTRIVNALFDDDHLDEWTEEKKNEIRTQINALAQSGDEIADQVFELIESEFI